MSSIFKDRIDIITKELDDEIAKLGEEKCERNSKPKTKKKTLPELQKMEPIPWKKVEQFPLPIYLYEEFNSLYDTGGVMYGPSFLNSRNKEYGKEEGDSDDIITGEKINALEISNKFKEKYNKVYEQIPLTQLPKQPEVKTKTDIQKKRETILRGMFGKPTMLYTNDSIIETIPIMNYF